MTFKKGHKIRLGIKHTKETKRKISESTKTHGMKYTLFYRKWGAMKDRCKNNKNPSYRRYGGRRIKVCESWNKFENFRDDMYESYLGHVKEFGNDNTQIDRINNNNNYCKDNCRWATRKEQANNREITLKIKYKGKTQTLIQWSKELNINYWTLIYRVHKAKWPIKDAFFQKTSNVALKKRT